MAKITLITPTQLSLNPRLVKEADALTEAGHEVTVLHAYWNEWGARFDKLLIPGKKWKAISVGGDPVQKPILFFLSRIIHKSALIINRWSGGKVLAGLAAARAAFFLQRAANKHIGDLYIGHNPGALAIVVQAAHRHGKLCGFDAEDFHRNEVSDNPAHPDVRLKTFLENKYFPELDYLEASSPAIASRYRTLFPRQKFTVILNAFPITTSIAKPLKNERKPIRLFWFSQTIGERRGLNDIVKALTILEDCTFELHILGYLPVETKVNYIDKLIVNSQNNIFFHKPIPAGEICDFASGFDLGLALEPGFNNNNSLALSNKLFTYLQAGLAVLVSDTTAQAGFMKSHPQIGKIYKIGDAGALASILKHYDLHREELYHARLAAFKLARETVNWENEKIKLIDLIAKILQKNG